jgi:hypothetical protein
MLNHLVGYFRNLYTTINTPKTYTSALEEFIVSNNPQNIHDVDRLERIFRESRENYGARLW